ncbi:MAG: class I SAM-dependent methyltransferase [Thermoanaerobaculia bacterium]
MTVSDDPEGLAGEYRRQSRRRDWSPLLDALPSLDGALVMDLGCGGGDVAEVLVARGARVLGVDLDEELLTAARARGLPGAEFIAADLRREFRLPIQVDGIWSSFLAAYHVDLSAALRRWAVHLPPGGWIALTEIDDLFAHEPVPTRTRELLDAYVDEALRLERYDFRMGRKLARHLEAAGFRVVRELALDDAELAFQGPASAEVLAAWSQRLDRMRPLRDVCARQGVSVREELLAALAAPDHACGASVRAVVAVIR